MKVFVHFFICSLFCVADKLLFTCLTQCERNILMCTLWVQKKNLNSMLFSYFFFFLLSSFFVQLAIHTIYIFTYASLDSSYPLFFFFLDLYRLPMKKWVKSQTKSFLLTHENVVSYKFPPFLEIITVENFQNIKVVSVQCFFFHSLFLFSSPLSLCGVVAIYFFLFFFPVL